MHTPPPIPEEAIRAIWRGHDLGDARRIVRLGAGSRNSAYVVDDALVTRFNTLDRDLPKFRSERIALELLAPTGVPVPRVVALDESRRIVPYDYLIATRLPGINLLESVPTLKPDQMRRLAFDAGLCLARIHAVNLDGFGKLRDLADAPFATWADSFANYAARQIEAGVRSGVLAAEPRARLRGVLDRAKSMLDRVTRAALVHSDFHYENLLQDAGRLSGVLDFEWALAGDPSYDFIAAAWREAMIPSSESAFAAGYRSIRPLGADHEVRRDVYALFFWLEIAARRTEQADPEDARRAMNHLPPLLRRVEASLGR
jgi:aminoglycoside phosphotransferase (APT) family kinase protein